MITGRLKDKKSAALKIKAAGIKWARENMSALRRLFFFCRRPAEHFILIFQDCPFEWLEY